MSTFKEYFKKLFESSQIDPCVLSIIVKNESQLLYGFTMNVYENSYEYIVPFQESQLENGTRIHMVSYKKHFYLVYKDNVWQNEL